jgi:membrane protein DedA with SNARE-associated domain
MIAALITWLQSLIVPLGGWGILVGSFLEEVIAPIPSALIQISGGFLLFEGKAITIQNFVSFILNLSIPAAVGVALGSVLVYYFVYTLGDLFITKYGKYFGITITDLEKFDTKLEKKHRDLWLVFVGRMIPGIPGPLVSAFAGIFKIPFHRYFPVSVLGTFIRATFYGFIGWQIGSAYQEYQALFDELEKYMLIVALVAITVFVIYRVYKKRKK